jgi:hypothetical protein
VAVKTVDAGERSAHNRYEALPRNCRAVIRVIKTQEVEPKSGKAMNCPAARHEGRAACYNHNKFELGSVPSSTQMGNAGLLSMTYLLCRFAS